MMHLSVFSYLQIIIFTVVGEGSLCCDLELFRIFLSEGRIHCDLWWFQGRHFHELKVRIASQFSCQPEEGFLEIVVGLHTDTIVLEQK